MTRQTSRTRLQNVRRQGFTLVEVLLVLAILGVIAAMVVPNLLGRQKEAMRKATVMSIKSMEDACKQYAIANDGEFPTGGSADVINKLLNPGNGTDGKPISPYLEKEPKDAWGNSLNYDYGNGKGTGTKPAIWSNGPDRKSDDGSGDDINNWTT